MTKRRSYGTGTVHTQVRNGREYWCAAVEVERQAGQKRRRLAVVRSKRTHTKKDVERELAALRKRSEAGLVGRDPTVEQYVNYWLETVKTSDVKQGKLKLDSLRLYEQWARLYVVPQVGRYRLRKLRPEHVRQMMDNLADAGLSPRIRNQARDLLSRAMKCAVGEGRLERNPCEFVSGANLGPKLDDAPTPEEVELILSANQSHRLYAYAYLMLLYGLRSKDIRGLKWADVNFTEGEFTVRSKTRNGDRTLPMIADTERLLLNLRSNEHNGPTKPWSEATSVRSARIPEHLYPTEYSEIVSPEYSEIVRPEQTYVFTNDQGKHLDNVAGQHWLLNVWHDMREAAGLPRVGRQHAARHAAAQAMRKRGVPIEVISDILGHSSIAVTRSYYLKADKDQARKALTEF
jgi:integrase